MKLRTMLLVMLAGLISLPAMAGHGFKHKHRHLPPGVVKQVLKEAGLSDGQIRNIETMRDSFQKQKLDQKHQLEKLHLEKRQMLKVYQVNEAALMKLIDQMAAVKLEMKKDHLRLRLKIRKEMTPQQWEKYRAIRAEKRQQFRKRAGKRGPRGQGK